MVNSRLDKIFAYFFACLSILWAFLMPSIIPNRFWDTYMKIVSDYDMTYDFILLIIWALFVLMTLKLSKWDKRFYWLFILFPVVFKDGLMMVLSFLLWSIVGFAP